MQKRHSDRKQYFAELAQTSERHLIPYLQRFSQLRQGTRVLELGCGDGGNLLPFSQKGCLDVGIDISKERISDAQQFFLLNNSEARFFVADITRHLEDLHEERFDFIICHDVVEHLSDKQALFARISEYLRPDGIALIAFPA